MSGPPKNGQPSPYFGDCPSDFFDFIVIDECCRGGANDEGNWRGIMDYFAHPDGTPMSAKQFMEMLFGKLPEFFKDEAELRIMERPWYEEDAPEWVGG